MGRLRQRYNWKARSGGVNASKEINQADNSNQNIVDVDFNVRDGKYDSSNPLIILPQHQKSNSKASKTQQLKVQHAKPLSKKKRKLLEKVLEKKKKKINRAEILEKLKKVQATSEEMELLTSTSVMQTSGLKRFTAECAPIKSADSSSKISNIKGSKKKGLLPLKKKLKLDPNVVGFEDEDTSSSSEDMEASGDEQEDMSKPKDDSLPVSSPVEIAETKQVSETVGKEEAIKKNVSEVVLEKILTIEKEPAVFVPVKRLPEIQAARESLPIFSEEQVIMEAIKQNSVVVIHGETGTGKTTQVPQFLYEGGYTQNDKAIGITEPRRIAAVSMCHRVAEEMNMPDAVSYHIRYEKNVDEKTKIKFMTDGVLLKEVRQDFLLSRYSVIIVDEAHERSVFSDVLIGLLSRIVPLRQKKGNPLKLIIMSATIRVEDFTENPRLFKEIPFLIRLQSRQYNVQIHFNLKTPEDYIEASYHKVCKIHKQLPPGAILVFLTGEKEVSALVKMLRKSFPERNEKSTANKQPELLNKNKKKKRKRKDIETQNEFVALPEKIDLDDYAVAPLDSEILQHQHSDGEERLSDNESTQIAKFSESSEPLYVLPLYSILPSEEQEKVFKPPPPGSRLCIVSTNVSETSITIPGLKYVVDSGKAKTKVFDKSAGGISSFLITWTSKASANQRAGRAGRTEGGHCYRLYSSAVFEHDFPEHTPPEIKRIPVDDVLLQMKALGIDRVVSFPFPTQPDTEALKVAEKRLVLLGALQDLQKGVSYKDIEKWEYSAKITPLGQAMSRFPLSPRYAKMLLMSYKHNVIQHAIAMVSSLTVPEVFLASAPVSCDVEFQNSDDEPKLWIGIKKIGAGQGKSQQLGDAMVLLRATALYEESKNKVNFCIKNGIRHKAMVEIHKMRIQLTREMNRSFNNLSLPMNLKIEPPTDEEIDTLRKILVTGFTDQIAKKISQEETRLDKSLRNGYKCLDLPDPVFIHPSSILFKELPELIVFQEIAQTTKYFMKNVVEIEPEWLPGLAPTLCIFSAPLEKPPPTFDPKQDKILCSMTSTFGRWQWDLPCVRIELPKGLEKYNWFCYFLLDGQVCPLFKEYKKHLLSSPSIMLKSWAKLLPRTRYLLQAIISKEIDTAEALYESWKNDSKFLLREYWEWLPEDKHMEVECKWPPPRP